MFRNLFEDNDFSAQLQYRCMLECPLLPAPPFLFSCCIHMDSYFSILCVARLLWGFAVCRRTLGLRWRLRLRLTLAVSLVARLIG